MVSMNKTLLDTIVIKLKMKALLIIILKGVNLFYKMMSLGTFQEDGNVRTQGQEEPEP